MDQKADPSEWIKGSDYKYSFTENLPAKIAAGDYILGVAIVDTTNNKPGVQLAIKALRKLKDGWFQVGTVRVHK